MEGNAKEIAESNAESNHQISLVNPNDFIPVQNVTISGTILYEDLYSASNNPVNNWKLRLYESDNYSDLEVIDENDPHSTGAKNQFTFN